MKAKHTLKVSRRSFMGTLLAAGMAPMVIPSRLLGQHSPSNLLRLGCIGTGRMGMSNQRNFQGHSKSAGARIVALCDVDRWRLEESRKVLEQWYASESADVASEPITIHEDYRDLIARDDIDAVVISTPDYWHARMAIDAARAGKGMFLEKPLTYSIRESQELLKTVQETGVVLQVNAFQRSTERFYRACWLVRNGRIGTLREVIVGNPRDGGTGDGTPTAVPEELNYDKWMGPTALMPYAPGRCHPRHGYGRPGWLQIQRYCKGMVTGWGAHMYDTAQWGMGTDLTGPVEISAQAEYPVRGIFDVHTNYNAEARYANGLIMKSSSTRHFNRFIGDEGWIEVTRGSLEASNPEMLRERPEGGIQLRTSRNHAGNFLECMRSGEKPVTSVDVAHHSLIVCELHHIAMKLGRTIRWDPEREVFPNDPEATAMMHYDYREPWTLA